MKALQLPERMRGGEWDIRRLGIIASAQAATGQGAEALKTLRAAEGLARDSASRLAVLSRKTSILISLGRFNEAIAASRQLIRLADAVKDPDLQTRGWAFRGLALGNAHRSEEAFVATRRALQLAEANHLGVAGAIRLNYAWLAYETGRLDEAEEVAKRVLSESVAQAGYRRKMLQQLGNIEQARQNQEQAIDYFRQAGRLAAPESAELAQALTSIAQQEVNLDQWEAARGDLELALAIKRKLKDTEGEMHALLVAGQLAEHDGRNDEADAFYARVAKEGVAPLLRWTAENYRGKLFEKRGQYAKTDEAFRRALTIINDQHRGVENEETKLAYTTLVATFFDDYVHVLASRNRPADALQMAELYRARTLSDAAGVEMSRFDPRQAVKRAGVVGLEYALGDKRSYFWVVTPERVRIFPLPARSEIEPALQEYAKRLRDPRGTLQTARGPGEKLFKLLIAPAASFIPPGARVAIVTDGRLNDFNLETLVVPKPTPHYWIEDVTIEIVPSLRLLGRRAAATEKDDRMLIVGNAPSSDKAFKPLPQAQREIDLVRRYFPQAAVLSGAAATPSRYAASAPGGFAYLHFVAHGVANLASPLESAVILAPDRSGYRLYARDIMKQPLRARLVTISSCVSAGRSKFEGEGLIGVGWAFLRAGAQQVVAALWEVSDSSVPYLMDAMYASMRRGNDVPAALREAKLQFLHSGTTRSGAIHWAPFVVYSGR
jgi:CHAT domain-containing protein